ncbi:hypothetical protein [Pseudomonas cremoricolorata]|uniref:hypothetical protein n=1 Tax=Pseudomonas cremoricolorata TaxID=157783 RepID=UPI0012E06D5C|nr:hypothetical protein [Pseudomonas cremoricolorata]
MKTREPSKAEIETLKEVLVASLPNTQADCLTEIAVRSAIAVKAAFEKLSQEVS